jgi:hypothetical protein
VLQIGLTTYSPAQVSLYVYDNNTLIVESFLPDNVNIKVITDKKTGKLNNILTGEEITGKIAQDGRIWGRERDDVMTFDVTIKPHSYLVFQGN